MKPNQQFDKHFGNALPPAILMLLLIWLTYWADSLFIFNFYKLGVLPKSIEGLQGVLFMPLVHSTENFNHIINNSIPIFLLTLFLFYFYKDIALKIVLYSWVLTGLGIWFFAANKGAYHIGMSGVIYSLVAFLFTSGTLRKYLPLQAFSMFIAFVYGSLIWGILPISAQISWEGHFMGLIVGVVLAIIYRKKGPQRPKYIYEIEKELGIDPPDLEGRYWEKERAAEEVEIIKKENVEDRGTKIIYHVKKDENDPPS